MKSHFLVILIFILISGCTSATVKQAEETLVWSSQEKRPEWTTKEPESKEGTLFFIGLSGKFNTEKEARDDAQRHAINNVVKYISTDVRDKFERLIVSEGLSSGIIDPTKVVKSFEEQLSSAVARRVKTSEWYIEKYQRKQGKEKETYYMVYLLAVVPQPEIDRVIAEQIRYQQEIITASKSANEKLTKAKLLVIEADNESASGPVQAMMKYQTAIKYAEESKATVSGFTELKGMLEVYETFISCAEDKIKHIRTNPETILTAGILGLSKNPDKPITVAIAKITYQQTDLSSEFANYLIPKIESIMSREKSLYTVIAQKVFQDESRKHRSSIEDCLSGNLVGATNTVMSSINTLFFAHYWERENDIEIKMELIEIGKGALLGSTSVELPKTMFPQDISYKPNNDLIAQEGLKAFSSVSADKDFKIRVWADKGEGSVYKKNEIVKFCFRSNKDCFVYLYHMDASGAVKLLFPNSFNKINLVKANQVYTIPDETMNFDFQITEPFGAEMVKAIASLQPIKDLEITPLEKGFRNIGKITDAKTTAIITRSIEAVPKEGLAENTCVITTIQ